jgi:hypothetical protein
MGVIPDMPLHIGHIFHLMYLPETHQALVSLPAIPSLEPMLKSGNGIAGQPQTQQHIEYILDRNVVDCGVEEVAGQHGLAVDDHPEVGR